MLFNSIYNNVVTDQRRVPRPAIIEGSIAMIPLGVGAKDGYAIVDKDFAFLADKYKWSVSNGGRYAVTGTYERRGVRIGHAFLHKVITGINLGGVVDHISRDTLDNRRCNLRVVDHRINQINSVHRGGTSKYRGVFWDKHADRWKAKIKNKGVTYGLGTFKNEVDAARAYNRGARKWFGRHASLNDV